MKYQYMYTIFLKNISKRNPIAYRVWYSGDLSDGASNVSNGDLGVAGGLGDRALPALHGWL